MTSNDEIGEEQKVQWNAAAVGWERSGDWFERNSGDLSRWLCDAAGLQPGYRVLDIACGTGQLAAAEAERVGPLGHVVATDLAPGMVAITRRRTLSLGNLEVQEMDAQALRFADASFDAVTCRFGLMFPPDVVCAVSEVHRVLRPNGRFAMAVWDVPAKNPFISELRAVLARFVQEPPPAAGTPGPFRLAPPGELERVLRAGGFSDITIESRPVTFTYASLDEYWQVQTDIASPLRAALARLSADHVAEIKAAALEAAAAHVEGGVLKLGAAPLCASARRDAR